jgi:hypothetical protein
MNQKANIYDQVLVITAEYLGPAAERFLYRQVTNHLGITPTELKKQDVQKLLTWIQLAMTILTNDQQEVDEYIDQLHQLIKSNKRYTPS